MLLWLAFSLCRPRGEGGGEGGGVLVQAAAVGTLGVKPKSSSCTARKKRESWASEQKIILTFFVIVAQRKKMKRETYVALNVAAFEEKYSFIRHA